MKIAKDIEKEATYLFPIISTRQGVSRNRKGLFYDYSVRITFNEVNIEGSVNHDKYATLFGKTKELFGLDCIPSFAEQIGKTYLFKTHNAIYNYGKDFHFGDTMVIRMRLLKIGKASFVLGAKYIDAKTGEIRATAEQTIVYTNMQGIPKRMPDNLKTMFNSFLPQA